MLKTVSLTPVAKNIICEKHTEYPNAGVYTTLESSGSYLCRQCGIALFRAKHKFHSGCGWPSFDSSIPNTVLELPDSDGRRVEILCQRCNAHLGHIFHGEQMTALNTRHCVNSLALDFVSSVDVVDSEEIILGAGCFWGVEYLLQNLTGVLKTEVGYSGGVTQNPTYKDICGQMTHHVEVIRIVYDPSVISYEQVIKYFFEIHDFTQIDGQGPDLGEQYLSTIFYYNLEQYQIAQQIIEQLEQLGYNPITSLRKATVFWLAEDYHQSYYTNNREQPYCHRHKKIF